MRENFKKRMIPPVLAVCLLSSFQLATAQEVDEATLEGVEVHSTSLEKYQVTTAVITAEKIKETGARNLAEALEAVPGLYMATADKNARLVRIRGAATDQTRVYIDGLPVFPLSGIASNSASDLAGIPVDNIEKIEIIKGPGPVQYGTDYKGGVILITTKDGKGPGQFQLNLAAGSDKRFDHSISYRGSDDNASYSFAAGKSKGDGYLRHSEFDKEYFDGKIKWKLGEGQNLTISGWYMNTDRDIANGIDQETGKETSATGNKWSGDTFLDQAGIPDPNQSKPDKNSTTDVKDWKYRDFKQTNIAVQYDQKVNDRFKYDVKVYHVTDRNTLQVTNGNNVKLGVNTKKNPQLYSSDWTSSGNGLELTADWQAARNNTVTFGAKYSKLDWDASENRSLNPGGITDGGSDKRIGYYLQDSWQLDSKTNLTAGVRHDKVTQAFDNIPGKTPAELADIDDSTTDPVFNLTHQLDEKNTLRFSAGKTHNFVTAKQANANRKAGYAVPGTEKATNQEIGWKHKLNEKASLDIAIFKNDIDNRIDRLPGKTEYRNIAKTEIRGVELEYNQQISKRLKGFVNYTYLKAEDTNAGVTTDAANLPDSMFNYGATYTVDKLQATLIGHYFGNVSNTDVSTPNNYGNIYKKLDSYHTVDLNFNYQENDNLSYYLHINNLFDTKYWDKYDERGDGINFMAGISMKM
ncbi:TonB-dependent receptor [Sporomusa sphaeroides]|uniref:Ferric enterobactin receptor n=2 Tax=Sporomusa TaxID=2375 RepID=A0ABM9VYJ3_9FIRM|nr:TonB-dependent receptor [Sporomusa sphaeroides]OLS57479.1 ferric enterobactin receptor precursor [Sporomusa sphaeroides DSM 2875]CVK17957.1 Ferric enterobactin receptor precursor [Sporomusa sphaeroides DSM 2875]SCM81182.1 TonB-dependent receptor [uncultured Sporomusa sp.]